MPRVIVTQGAAEGLERCRRFLIEKNPLASTRAAQVIGDCLNRLENDPGLGRLVAGQSMLREMIIPFGSSGYIALYRHDETLDLVFVLAFRHQKELGF